MNRQKGITLIFLVSCLLVTALLFAEESKQSEREAMYYRYLEFDSYVKGGSVEPHWMVDGSSFWYAEGTPANSIIWKVDSRANTKTPVFDTSRLRKELTSLLEHEPPYLGLPFDHFTFVDESEQTAKFTVEDKEFILRLDTYKMSRAPALSEEEKSRLVRQRGEERSPDGSWFAGSKDHNIYLRSTYDGRNVQLTTDGTEEYKWYTYGARWSPDSFKLAVGRANYRKMHSMPVVHWLKPMEEVEWVHFWRADGPLAQIELFIIDILSKRQVRIDIGKEPDQYIWILGWRPDGSELLFARMNREFKKLDLMAGNPSTGASRVVLTETQKTFVRGYQYDWPDVFILFEDGKTFIWMAERDGWNHIYMYDMEGNFIRRLTKGTFPVVEVVAVDEKTGWVYFTAHGDRKRPYDTHLYRVNLEGKGFTRLTEARGQHTIQFAPSKEFFLDTHSSTDRPPAVELRRADGMLLQTLSKANIDAFKELKWRPPDEFVVKATDGKTDLYGILFKPYDFDPKKKYPVIEYIYAGPQTTIVPRTFIRSWSALAQLGFIVFRVDGRGTPERGKEFQDVVYGNLGRYEVPDHVATLNQLADKRPYMDLTRVGIYGYSWGGHFAMRALLMAPDVYHVGIAGAPDVDLYYHDPLDVETWMGSPQNNKEAYDYGSNLWLAGNLKGKLLIIHGTSDVNVPFAVTMKMIEALIRAGKPYDLIVLPEQSHRLSGTSRTYYLEAIRRYFQEHLKPEIGN